MNLFDVYPLNPVTIAKGEGCYVYDDQGQKYLDLYGGHAVISVGHSHPDYVAGIQSQLEKLAFYSNSVINPVQSKLAERLGEVSEYADYSLFLCSSGAEANENALKLASFATGKKKVVAFEKGFHGRTSLAVAVTDNPKIQAPANPTDHVSIVPFNDLEAVEAELAKGDVCAVIYEPLQGVAGIREASHEFQQGLSNLCAKYDAKLIADEVQAGAGRTGKFFAHQWAGIKPDIVTVAKGLGNGFPVGAALISPDFEASYGLLGTTFGGNHLACAAALSVLDIIEKENLMDNAIVMEELARNLAEDIPEIKKITGKGLMLGFEFESPIAQLRKNLLLESKIFTGNASNPNVLRILPPLNVSAEMIGTFFSQLKLQLSACPA
ncbi:acetylornithine aminotransferase (plasmid) [Fulvitalea axinellae]|uniref:Acetylornithine aminotransferase n=1 Tax=Fulvitalea axinellae TaxID=1182444 RepID=A0AAU9D5Z3_9BACT|nr:acetylornithine aminotransferase [Fulvitalea axinellae]